AQPKCFPILQRLRKECEIAVWHDDQQGTATINVAGLINALKVVGKKMPDVAITLIGAGASNIRTAKLLIAAGASPEHIILVDSKGIVCRHREDIEVVANDYAEKWELALKTNGGDREGGIAEAMRAVDVAIAAGEKGRDETHIVPTMDEIDVFAREATAGALKAMEQGIARETKTRDALYQGALELIRRAREETKFLMQDGFIRPPPP